jgi:beta-hydroxylase
LFYAFSSVKNSAYIDVQQFSELKILEENWELIRDEAICLNDASQIKAAEGINDLGFNSFFRRGWKRFYLKWYGSTLNSANQLCPKTAELLSSIPSVKAAMFAMLPPGSKLNNHRDPYAGSLRYHLGLATPNSDDCYIMVDDEFYSWRDGEAVMFDETFIHRAKNDSDKNRIILFLDIERPVVFFLVRWVNKIFSYVILSATSTKNIDGDKVGLLNKAFFYTYQIRRVSLKLKSFNQPLYYTFQYAFYLLIIYFIFF